MRPHFLLLLLFCCGATDVHAAPAEQEQTLEGCVCGVDKQEKSVDLVPWNQEQKRWVQDKRERLAYTEKTTIQYITGWKGKDFTRAITAVSALLAGRQVVFNQVRGFKHVGGPDEGVVLEPVKIGAIEELAGHRFKVETVQQKSGWLITRMDYVPYFATEQRSASAAWTGDDKQWQESTGKPSVYSFQDDLRCPCETR